MKVWLGTPEQKVAACTVLLMAGLCLFDYRNEFDMPHMHLEDPIMPTTFAGISMFGSNTASVSTYRLDLSSGP